MSMRRGTVRHLVERTPSFVFNFFTLIYLDRKVELEVTASSKEARL